MPVGRWKILDAEVLSLNMMVQLNLSVKAFDLGNILQYSPRAILSRVKCHVIPHIKYVVRESQEAIAYVESFADSPR